MKIKNSRAGRTLVLLFFFASPPAVLRAATYGRVVVPVADVRAASGTLPRAGEYDPGEETQLLFGDTVKILSRSGDWLRIEAPGQPEFSHHGYWQGYPGWVLRSSIARSPRIPSQIWVVVRRKSTRLYEGPDDGRPVFPLSLGTRLPAFGEVRNGYRRVRTGLRTSAWIPEQDLRVVKLVPQVRARRILLDAASELLGDSYFWGGCSANMPELKDQITAVDCSGLVYLAYRVAGLGVPRDSLEQYLKARKIRKDKLKPGDLIFSASKDQPDKVTHVAIFIDSSTLIEAPKTGEQVHKISFQDKYGVPFEQIEDGQPIGDRILRFGTYFANR